MRRFAVAPLALALLLGAGEVRAQANDMFPTRQAAASRARQLQCSGVFAMGDQWMPCRDLPSYEKAVARKTRG